MLDGGGEVRLGLAVSGKLANTGDDATTGDAAGPDRLRHVSCKNVEHAGLDLLFLGRVARVWKGLSLFACRLGHRCLPGAHRLLF